MTQHQQDQFRNIDGKKIALLLSPAGGGKTFVAVQCMLKTIQNGNRILFVARNKPLALLVVKWLILASGKSESTVIGSVSILTKGSLGDFSDGPQSVEVVCKGQCRFLNTVKSDNSIAYGLVIVDEAHHIIENDILRKQLRNYDCRYLFLGDASQASCMTKAFMEEDIRTILNLDSSQHVGVARLTEVVRSTKRIVSGAGAFQLNSGSKLETTTHTASAGLPLVARLFPLAEGTTKKIRFWKCARHTVTAILCIKLKLDNIDLNDRVMIVCPNDEFVEDLRKPLVKQLDRRLCGRHDLVSALEASSSFPPDAFSTGRANSSQRFLFDAIEQVDGPERLIVVAVGLDTPIEQTTADFQTRSSLCRAITRAQLSVAVVNETMSGGWLEFLGVVRFDDIAYDDNRESARESSKPADTTLENTGASIDNHDHVRDGLDGSNGRLIKLNDKEGTFVRAAHTPVDAALGSSPADAAIENAGPSVCNHDNDLDGFNGRLIQLNDKEGTFMRVAHKPANDVLNSKLADATLENAGPSIFNCIGDNCKPAHDGDDNDKVLISPSHAQSVWSTTMIADGARETIGFPKFKEGTFMRAAHKPADDALDSKLADTTHENAGPLIFNCIGDNCKPAHDGCDDDEALISPSHAQSVWNTTMIADGVRETIGFPKFMPFKTVETSSRAIPCGVGDQRCGQWSGMASCGNELFCAPHNADSVLVIDGDAEETHTISCGVDGFRKWQGIARHGNKLFCAPHDADDVLVIDGESEETHTIPCGVKVYRKWPEVTSCGNKIFCAPHAANDYCYGQWSGMASCGNKLFCAPHNADCVLVIDGDTEETHTISCRVDGHCKWQGIARCGNKLFCAPHNAESILVVDAKTESIHTIPLDVDGEDDSDLVDANSDVDSFADYNYGDSDSDSDAAVRRRRIKLHTFQRWHGIVRNGNKLFCAPHNSNSVLVIDGETEEIHTIPCGMKGVNKWNGIASYGNKLFCVPSSAETILVIDGETEKTYATPCGVKGSGKWQGVAQHKNKLFCAPEDADAILIIENREVG